MDFGKCHSYCNVLENASTIISSIQSDDAHHERIEAFRIYNNCFVGLIKNEYPYRLEKVSDDEIDVVLEVGKSEYRCGLGVLKSQLKKDLNKVIPAEKIEAVSGFAVAKQEPVVPEPMKEEGMKEETPEPPAKVFTETPETPNVPAEPVGEPEIAVTNTEVAEPQIDNGNDAVVNNAVSADAEDNTDIAAETEPTTDTVDQVRDDVQAENTAEPVREEQPISQVSEATEQTSSFEPEQGTNGTISKQNLLFDKHLVKITPISNGTASGESEEIMICVYPMNIPQNKAKNLEIVVVAKQGSDYKLAASPNTNGARRSVQIEIGGKEFLVRGSWTDKGFESFIYASGSLLGDGYKVETTKDTYRPANKVECSHCTMTVDGIKLHIFPGGEKNTPNGMADVLFYTEEQQRQFIVPISSNILEFQIGGKMKNLVAFWEGDLLKAECNDFAV